MSEAAFDLSRVLVLIAALLLALILEHLLPHAPLARPWRTNLGLWLTNAAVMRVACGACGFALAASCEVRGFGALRWLAAPTWLALPAGIVALDAVSYFWHRANHRVAWLWRFHRVHHADRAFQVTTALRFHPGELLLALPLRLAAIALFGLSPLGVLAFEAVFGAMNLLEHGNFDLPRRAERPCARVFVTPALHRLHHARERTDLDSNFGTVFSGWDRALGTLRASDGARSVETGLPGAAGAHEMSFARALWAPFTRGASELPSA